MQRLLDSCSPASAESKGAEILKGGAGWTTTPRVRSLEAQAGKAVDSSLAFVKTPPEKSWPVIVPGTEPAVPDWLKFSTSYSPAPAGCFSQ